MSRSGRMLVANDGGAAAVEFALLLPLILVLVLGIIDFGGMLHGQVTLTQAAREGARVAALRDASDPAYDGDEIARRTRAAVRSPLIESEDIVVDPMTCPNDDDDALVALTYDFEFITPVGSLIAAFGGEGFGPDITLSATGVMPCET